MTRHSFSQLPGACLAIIIAIIAFCIQPSPGTTSPQNASTFFQSQSVYHYDESSLSHESKSIAHHYDRPLHHTKKGPTATRACLYPPGIRKVSPIAPDQGYSLLTALFALLASPKLDRHRKPNNTTTTHHSPATQRQKQPYTDPLIPSQGRSIHDYGYRYYAPDTGRWLSREPLGESESLNLYAYCHGDPINKVDVLGLAEKEILHPVEADRFRYDIESGQWMVRINKLKRKWYQSDWRGNGHRWEAVIAGDGTPHSRLRAYNLHGLGPLQGPRLTSGGELIRDTFAIAAPGLLAHRKAGTIVLGVGSAVFAAPAVLAGGASVSSSLSGAGTYTYVVGTNFIARPAMQKGLGYGMAALSAGTFYGMSQSDQFAGEVLTAEQLSPIPGEGLVYGVKGLGMIADDAGRGLGSLWQYGRSRGGPALEGWLYRNGSLSYAMEPGAALFSNTTRTGIKRTNPADWRATRDLWDQLGYPELLSLSNRSRIAAGRTPLVDNAWVMFHPEDAGLLGERISMHHVQGLPITVPLPASRHLDAHMPGGFRYNPGNTGSQLPIYPPLKGN